MVPAGLDDCSSALHNLRYEAADPGKRRFSGFKASGCLGVGGLGRFRVSGLLGV